LEPLLRDRGGREHPAADVSPAGATLFTIGYEKRSLEEFLGLLVQAGVTALVDARETALSRKPGFSKRPLSEALAERGIEYVHAKFAGNPKWLRESATTHAETLALYDRYLAEHPEVMEAFEELVGGLQRNGKEVRIMCFERRPEDCHRGSWRRGGWWGLARA
jgi:uncharacterized protein (DUF488 family)